MTIFCVLKQQAGTFLQQKCHAAKVGLIMTLKARFKSDIEVRFKSNVEVRLKGDADRQWIFLAAFV
jgi:hypothetical protein